MGKLMVKTGRKPDHLGVREAREKLRGVVPDTPLLPLKIGESTVWCKCESDQPMGAFKLRGAWHRLTALSEAERKKGVVAFSSGNHAQGVAWAAQKLGISAAIVMPSDAPRLKIEGTKRLGGEVILYDRKTESREEIADQLARERGSIVVPSFDDPWVIEGQGSLGLELIEQLGKAPDLVVSPCGGGGLASGIALALPDAGIAIVEPEGWDDMAQSLENEEIVPVGPDAPPTSCDALQTPRVSRLTFDILLQRQVLALSVSEKEIFTAMRLAYSVLGKRIEPGGAVALAALLAGKISPRDCTVAVLSGGNVDPEFFEMVLKSP
jgi:threonine dehydratase